MRRRLEGRPQTSKKKRRRRRRENELIFSTSGSDYPLVLRFPAHGEY